MTQMGKNLPAVQRPNFEVGKIPWRREWLSSPLFLPGEFHELSYLVGCCPQNCEESERTEQLTLSLFTFIKRYCLFKIIVHISIISALFFLPLIFLFLNVLI